MGEAAGDLVVFLVMFFIIMFSYAQAFHMAFGMDLADFKGGVTSIFTLMRMILGDFDFEALRANNKYLGPLLFLTFIVLVFFILLNMFLAIINDAYTVVKG